MAKPKRRPATDYAGFDGFDAGMAGRPVGAAQGAVVAALRPWLIDRFGSVQGIAERIGVERSAVAHYFRSAAAFPPSRARAWARALGRGKAEREAILELLAIAGANRRVLDRFGWEVAVEEIGQQLKGSRRQRAARIAMT